MAVTRRAKEDNDHIRALANWRGCTLEEAAAWFREQLLIEKTEAQLLGKLDFPMAVNQSPEFAVSSEEAAPPAAHPPSLAELDATTEEALNAALKRPRGKRSIIAERGVLLPRPRMSTPEEDYEFLVEETERVLLDENTITQQNLNQAAGILRNEKPKDTVFLAASDLSSLAAWAAATKKEQDK